jgi:hypothetical protein
MGNNRLPNYRLVYVLTTLFFFFLLFCFFTLAGLKEARSHSWYPYECCSDNDCAKIKTSSVREVNGGFEVIVRPGDHKMTEHWTEPMVYHFPYNETKGSEDQSYHICLSHTKTALCFFAPTGGV